MGEDEAGTLRELRTHRREFIDPKIAEHKGRIVKTTGDGLLAAFASVVDALGCAGAWQAAVPTDSRITWRIGIHQGDVVVEDGDIFGDGVNIAARLEGLAEPGGICVSARVQEDAIGKLDLPFEDIGEQNLKDIARPVRAYRVRIRAASAARTTLPASRVSRLSIVVLPFTNLSSEPEQEYFVDAITDDLTTDLSRIDGSFVISRNTAFTYKGKPVDVQQLGRDLRVHYVLEGSIRRLGGEVQINVQLIDAESGGHLWADRFDAELANVAKAQREITARLASTLRLQLLEAVDRRIDQDQRVNVDARDLVMRGWALYNRPVTPANREQAQQAFERALVIAPDAVDARVGLVAVVGENLAMNFSPDRERDITRADRLLEEVLERDPNHPRARAELGRLRRLQGRLAESRIDFDRALALDRNSPFALNQCGITLLFSGRPEEALPYFEKYLVINPRTSNLFFVYYWLGHALLLLGNAAEAIVYLRRSRSENPRSLGLTFPLAAALALKGNLDEAKHEWSEWLKFRPAANSMMRVAAHFEPLGLWTPSPEYAALRQKTIDVGLRLLGVPEN
jgi:TolB-like protein/Tfp pilus assembly protein PilF